jgi:CheY-like chemotaxis protein
MSTGARALAGLRILVVDDNQDTLEPLVRLLALNGAAVRSCRSAKEARELLARFRADLMISDLAMPGEDGFDFIMSIRRLPEEQGGRTPAIAFTAVTDAETRERALRAGYEEFVPKLEITTLISSIAALAARGRG